MISYIIFCTGIPIAREETRKGISSTWSWIEQPTNFLPCICPGMFILTCYDRCESFFSLTSYLMFILFCFSEFLLKAHNGRYAAYSQQKSTFARRIQVDFNQVVVYSNYSNTLPIKT